MCPDCEARAREYAEQHLEDMKAAPARLAEWRMSDLADYRARGNFIWIGYTADDCPGEQWDRIAVIHTAPGMAAYVWTPKAGRPAIARVR
jgi:hypothetical protein